MGKESTFYIELNIPRQKAFELVKKSLAKDSLPKIVNENEVMASPAKLNDIDSPYYFYPESNRISKSYFSLKEINPPQENQCLISGLVVTRVESALRRAVYALKEHLEELGLEVGLEGGNIGFVQPSATSKNLARVDRFFAIIDKLF